MGQCDRCYCEFESQQATQQQIRANNKYSRKQYPSNAIFYTFRNSKTCPLDFIPVNPPYRVPKGTKPSRRYRTQTVIYRLTNSMNYGHYDSKSVIYFPAYYSTYIQLIHMYPYLYTLGYYNLIWERTTRLLLDSY